MHPSAGSHESVVQAELSLQLVVAPDTQAPPRQKSSVVQAFESVQVNALFVLTQPVSVSQESVVHTLLSLQLTAAVVHPSAGSHESVVQALPSSHAIDEP
ncbi:MAG: hypothetical protein A2821_02795 [Candidatus Magasanikbacteria bacterium RIFCSPHIGHO2_01_FULL_41_23]|nr:MAG: hypothetical protein A2821_02795 [Candidatus Magasanikbacteria bacterium RIFCSPHIGHO2_01_FULL_41_23]OGH67265.1 MAG: hypothetical protein A3C66_00810 [Candidatus Magasanikbacteria bacterium RIFCSPHIGHO2_02_FULL_41_35]OGH76490.1 MAG: hypothetical protein A3F22_00020 [Candidatus Magasanikbacteria bacterium RIFCSPHIGHO2_12_FULL_41_16]